MNVAEKTAMMISIGKHIQKEIEAATAPLKKEIERLEMQVALITKSEPHRFKVIARQK